MQDMMKTLVKSSIDSETLYELFRALVGNSCRMECCDGYVVFEYSFDPLMVRDMLESLEAEGLSQVLAYTTRVGSCEACDYELSLVLDMLLLMRGGVYDLKSILLRTSTMMNKREILKLIIDGSGVDEQFIYSFASMDLNVTRASKEMFIHRNTMIYKLDRLYELTGFDLRRFRDSYILFSLVDSSMKK